MTIDTVTSDPISQKLYPIAMKNYQWVEKEIDKLLTARSYTAVCQVGQCQL